ncbi:hypothetical protein FA95DRAFT_1505691 [Auriscalpium vulgare]|uniref:Uncharacterized protein n=1 Tax=Auriscalpium vulgare TaxID=40419 RepID=A0ACB8R2S2_9AGAM|nr:hypothetical protein FA95DRAFT_1505691 [Auriscalpium vulgare]
MRNENDYRKTLDKLNKAATKTARAKITRETGVSRMPLCMAMPAFLHPSFFPLDPFHLIYENCMAYFWDLWTTFSSPGEIMHIKTDKAREFGRLVADAVITLPPVFSGPIRDPFLKRQSQYKIFEWMALLHWYVIPIGTELGFNPIVLANFAEFVEIVDFAMAIKPYTKDDLRECHMKIAHFLKEYERIYVGSDPEKVSLERAIGEIGRKVRSKKAPFANVATIIYERELLRVLLLHYPLLQVSKPMPPKRRFKKEIRILKSERKKLDSQFNVYLKAIYQYIQQPIDREVDICQWTKHLLNTGHTLSSRLAEANSNSNHRSSIHFEGKSKGEEPIFGKALAFYEMLGTDDAYVIFYPLINCKYVLQRWKGNWAQKIQVLPVSSIKCMIGIMDYKGTIHILRKHPGSEMLSTEELGVVEADIDIEGADVE